MEKTFNRNWRTILVLLGISLAFLPFINLVFILFTNGVNNITNDNLLITPIFDQILNGAYEWKNVFRDIFINGHFQFFTLAIQFGTAKFFDWNVYVLIIIGFVLALLRIFFLYLSIENSTKIKVLLLILLSFLTFSTSQISTFEFDWNTIMINLCFFGIALGVWGLVTFRGKWLGVGIMSLGGLIASWTSGSGIVAWLTFLLGMWLLQYRKLKYFIFWLIFGILISWPYYLYLFQEPKQNPYSTFVDKISFFKIKFIITSIGLPLSQGFSSSDAFWRGLTGIGLGLVGLLILLFNRKNKKLIRQSSVGLILLTFSLLNAWQISLFREFLVPFYTAYFMLFWVGLSGLGITIFENRKEIIFWLIEDQRKIQNLLYFWIGLVGIILSYFYFTSNLTYEDKTATLKNRSPVSASCLRNYKTAPTYCEKTILTWLLKDHDEYRTLAEKLERNRLSVFGLKQRWTLQGDFILNNIEVEQHLGVPPIFWALGLDNRVYSFSDFKHLNLFIHSPNGLRWTFKIPENVQKMKLHSAVAINEKAPIDARADGLTVEIGVERPGKPFYVLYRQYLDPKQREWEPFTISLEKFSGETITLRFSSDPGKNNLEDWAMFRFPYIDLELSDTERKKYQKSENGFVPTNTELSSTFPTRSDEDFNFDITRPNLWMAARIQPVQPAKDYVDTWIIQDDPILEYKPELDICLSDYSDFYVKMAGTPNWKNRELQIYYRLNHQKDFEEIHSVKIPIIADGKSHAYTYDLKLLGIGPETHLTGIRLDPVLNQSPSNNQVKISEFHLLKRKGQSLCSL